MLNINVAMYCQGVDYKRIEGLNKEINHKINSIKKPNVNFTSIYYYDIIAKQNENLGTLVNTPMLSKLLEDIKGSKKFDMVAIPTMDILGENLQEVREKIDEFHKYGVQLFPVNDEYFRIKNNLEIKLFSNSVNRIKVPYGYTLHKGSAIPHIDRNIKKNKPLKNRKSGNIVQWIFHSFLTLKSYSEVTNTLNEKNVPSPLQTIKEKKGRKIKSSKWNRQQVKNILTNNFYLEEKSSGQKYCNLINESLWNKTQQIIKEIQRN